MNATIQLVVKHIEQVSGQLHDAGEIIAEHGEKALAVVAQMYWVTCKMHGVEAKRIKGIESFIDSKIEDERLMDAYGL
jgi:hypothetical protein